jgi:HAD superfamily hydrolase (TIGR01484 family)
MPPRLLAIDLDGTLLTRQGVSDHDRDAIRQARSAGVEIVVATGRAWLESREALDAIGDDGVMIGAGGALLHEAASGRTLARSVVHPEVVEAIATSLRSHGHVVHLLQDAEAAGFDYWMVGWDRLHEASRWWFDRHAVTARWAGRIDQVDDLSHTVRVGTTASGTHLEQIAEELRSDLGGRVMLQSWPAVVESEATGETIHLLEAFDPLVDKWTMLSRLAADRGIATHEIAAIGDGLNDVGMIRGAGVGIAMAGADRRVRAVADAETGLPGRGVGDAVLALLDGSLVGPAPESPG